MIVSEIKEKDEATIEVATVVITGAGSVETNAVVETGIVLNVEIQIFPSAQNAIAAMLPSQEAGEIVEETEEEETVVEEIAEVETAVVEIVAEEIAEVETEEVPITEEIGLAPSVRIPISLSAQNAIAVVRLEVEVVEETTVIVRNAVAAEVEIVAAETAVVETAEVVTEEVETAVVETVEAETEEVEIAVVETVEVEIAVVETVEAEIAVVETVEALPVEALAA